MVDDEVFRAVGPQAVDLVPWNSARSQAQMADDNVMRVVQYDLTAANTYPVAGGRLAGNGQIRFSDVDRTLELNDSARAEDDGARPPWSGRLHGSCPGRSRPDW